MRAMILAAGYGTRLGTLSDERPKVLLPVCDQPLIRFALALVRGAGIREVVINLHHQAELVEAEMGDGASAGVRVAWSREPRLLGTGGGVKQAAPLLGDETFVVVNGKVVIDLDLAAVVAAHRQAGALATMVVRPDPDAARWGAIAVDEGGRVRDLLGAGGYMFTGVHVVEPELLARIPDGEQCIIRTAYQGALRDHAPLHAFVQAGYFAEHSTLARYLDGNVALLRGATAAAPPTALRGIDAAATVSPDAVIHEPVRLGPRARIGAGAVIGPDVVVGHDAEVAPDARLRECVVWDGARAAGELTRAIVTPAAVHQL
ncbi:MAG: NDP-sugar synthase [Deltaproteobacteria bacterium]|nr:NDP-sugar synthase [Deltaproteobacteria bacterium]